MRLTENPGRVEAWVYRHASWLVAFLIVIVIPLSAVTGWLVIDELKQGGQLRGVGVAGPCRAFGIRNDECQKQSRRIFAACYIQHEECWDKYGLPDLIRRSVNPLKAVPKYGSPSRGGDALQTGPTGSQQPGPRGGGGSETAAGKGGGGRAAQPGQGGTGGPSAPVAGGSDPVPSPPSGGSDGHQSSAPPPPPANEPADPEPHPLPETVEAAGGAVEKAGDAAQDVVEETGKAAGCVLRGSC